MYMWEELESNITTGQQFDARSLARHLGSSRRYASDLIQAYLIAQRGPRSQTQYVISRRGRTRSAVWHVGARTGDVRALTRQCVDDIAAKINEALAPDLRRMGVLNPRCAQLTEAMAQVFVANLNLLTTQVP